MVVASLSRESVPAPELLDQWLGEAYDRHFCCHHSEIELRVPKRFRQMA